MFTVTLSLKENHIPFNFPKFPFICQFIIIVTTNQNIFSSPFLERKTNPLRMNRRNFFSIIIPSRFHRMIQSTQETIASSFAVLYSVFCGAFYCFLNFHHKHVPVCWSFLAFPTSGISSFTYFLPLTRFTWDL